MPFANYKNFEDCVRKNQDKDDPPAFCAWLQRKVEGQDPYVTRYLVEPRLLYGLWRLELMSHALLSLDLLTKEDAEAALKGKDIWKDKDDAVVLDDHRWIHVWAETLERGHSLFISKKQLKELHDKVVDELAKRGLPSGLKHESPIKVSPLELGGRLEALLKSRQPFLIDPEGIVFIGSNVVGKENPNDDDVMWGISKKAGYAGRLLDSLPEKLRETIDQVWDPGGPNGPYIPGYELWAIPVKNPQLMEPRYHINPMSPLPPATASFPIKEARQILEDSYFVAPIKGIRLMLHRRESQVIAYDEDLDEADIPDQIAEAALKIEEPRSFILDGFLARESGEPVFYMLDLPWWRESEHIRLTAEERRYFLSKIAAGDHLKMAPVQYFTNRRDTVEYLEGEDGPLLLIPGMTTYPIDGAADWYLYDPGREVKMAEGSDARIKDLVDSGRWEGMSASERFSLMTKRRRVEPLYPFAQLKTTKKGYSEREVFGLQSVQDLAEELFRVPNKQGIEVKIDGFRVQAHKKGDQVRLYTESGHEITKQLPSVVADAKRTPSKSFVVDTEATPYDQDLTNLGRAGAAPAFAKGAKGPVDDSMWALHVFDILSIDGEDLHDLPYEERRKRLHGLEFPVRDVPKSKADFKFHLWENNVSWATTAEQMIKTASEVAKVAGSEGAMFKQADSKYRLNGNTPLWSKMKVSFEIDALVVGIIKKGNTFNYIGAIGPVSGAGEADSAPLDSAKGKKFVKWKGKTYSVLGKTFNTGMEAKVGDIIRVTMKDMRQIEDKVYHWFQPKVLEKREDKTAPDPLQTAETISKTAKGKMKRAGDVLCVICGKPAEIYFGAGTFCRECYESRFESGAKSEAYLVSARFGFESPLASCTGPWIAVPRAEGWVYLANDDHALDRLKEFGVELVIGTGMERSRIEGLVEKGMDFQLNAPGAILDVRGRPLMLLEPSMPDEMPIDAMRLREFLDEIRSPPMYHMKLSCCATVPIERILLLGDPYMVYPGKPMEWSLQFHLRGLSVHGDFRMKISKSKAIGWTWDAGKSLIKPMLRRTPRELRVKAGITERDLQLPISELSGKLRSTKEGKALMRALTKKTQELSFGEIKKMMAELWRDEMDPILADPNRKILTQRKPELSPEWLYYEEEVPPGASGATKELEGQLVIMDKGTVEFGTQKPHYHEYFIRGDRVGKRRLVVRKIATRKTWGTKETFAWLTFFTKLGERPYAISRRAVTRNWMPPKGVSALPKSVEAQIPDEYRYWAADDPRKTRDALVDAIGKGEAEIKLARGLQFAVKRVWHKGPEVKRGLPVTRYWLLIHDGGKILDAFDFGKDSNPLEETGLSAKRVEVKGLNDLLKTTGDLEPGHPASWVKKIKTSFDTSDEGKATVLEDANSLLRLRLSGEILKGEYAFVKQDDGSWVLQKTELSEEVKAMFLSNWQQSACVIQDRGMIIRLSAPEVEVVKHQDRLLLIRGPAIKPGEVLPMDGRPTYFTKDGIRKFWPSMYRQPVVILHGDLKGDVIGFVGKNWFDEKTGWGWVEAIIWHPVGIQLILDKKLAAFSIEVLPESVWDAEHQHDHVIGGSCVGLAVVPKGACPTCVPIDARTASIKIMPGKTYKFGMPIEDYLADLYWRQGLSTVEISEIEGIPRSTLESWMDRAGYPRRSRHEARLLRMRNEEEVLKLGGRGRITALGTGAFTDIPRDDCPQCRESRAGGKSRRNYTATMFSVGPDNLIVNAPKGISSMLGGKKAKPRFVLLEHMHEDVIGGLHELAPLKPAVFATKGTWNYLHQHYRALSGQKKGEFEKLYDFPRYIIVPGKKVEMGPFVIEAVEVEHAKPGDPAALGFRIELGDKTIWHCSDVYRIPKVDEALKGVNVFIGDGASLRREIVQKRGAKEGYGHTSMENQIKWAQEADIPTILFTQIGHVGKTHDDLNRELKEMGGNVQAFYDGAELTLGGINPTAILPRKVAEGLLSGKVKVLLRTKPYSEYAKQAILFGYEENLLGLYVEGFPEGPLPIKEAEGMEHGLGPRDWDQLVGDAEQIWIYRPRVLRRFQPPRRMKEIAFVGPYIHNAMMVD